jgi:hypothetical protein
MGCSLRTLVVLALCVAGCSSKKRDNSGEAALGGDRLSALHASANTLLDQLVQQETQKDVTCWTSFRQLDWFIAEKSYSEFGTLAKIAAMKALVRGVWEKASAGAQGGVIVAADVERAVKLPKIALPGQVQTKLSSFANDIGLKNFNDYQKTAEHMRMVLSVIQDVMYTTGGNPTLKPLDATGVKALGDAATTLSLMMLKESAKAAEAAQSLTIEGPHVQVAHKQLVTQLGLKNDPYSAKPLDAKLVEAHIQPLTRRLIDNKVEALLKFNKGSRQLVPDLNKVTRVPLTDDAVKMMLAGAQSFARFVAAGFEPMQADNYLSDGSFAKSKMPRLAYVDVVRAQNVVTQLFPHDMHADGDVVVRFEPNPGPVTDKKLAPFEIKLIGHEMDGVRDSAVHWEVLQNVWKEMPFAMDPFAAEYLSEVVSMMFTLWIRRAELVAQKTGAKQLDGQVMRAVFADKDYVMVHPGEHASAAWTPERQKTKQTLLAAYAVPLFKDVSKTAGLPVRFATFGVDLDSVKAHVQPDTKDVKGHVAPDTKDVKGHVQPDTKDVKGHVAPDTKGVKGHVQPDTKDVKGHVQPDTKDQKAHVQPDTKDVKGHVQPDTKDQKAHVQPDTKDVKGHVQPDTKDQKAHVQPDTKDQKAHVQPDTKDVKGHVEPDTKNVPGHVEPDTKDVQGHFDLQIIMGGGIAVGDVNGDEYPDLYMTGEELGRLYLNQGKAGPGKFKDATAAWGLPTDQRDGHGTLFFDYDGDGKLDLLVLRSDHPSQIFHQEGGKLVDTTSKLGLQTFRGAHVANVLDYDKDGDLDIYIGYYGAHEANKTMGKIRSVPSLDGKNGSPNQLWRNDGDHFTEVGEKAGVADLGWTLAIGSFDADGDGDLDLYLANDFGANSFYRNNGDGTFADVTEGTGTGDRGSGMNVEITDINSDGKWDLYVTNIDMFSKNIKVIFPRDESTINVDDSLTKAFQYISGNKLYVSTPTGGYKAEEGIRFEPKDRGWGWDASFFDYENDGDDDCYVTNGWIEGSYAGNQKNQMYINHDGFLYLAPESSDEAFPGNTRSAAAVDIDLDGDLDLVANQFRQPPRVLVNQQKAGNQFVQLKLTGKGKNRFAVGATVKITANGKTFLRQVTGGRGYLSQADTIVTAGVGQAKVVDVDIVWPDGSKSHHAALPTGKRHAIAEP